MTASTNQGDFSFARKEEWMDFIRQRRKQFPIDEIWVSGEKDYPCMALLTNGPYASINYFEDADGDMWLSEGDLNREVAFSAGGEEWLAPADAVISFDEAVSCIGEFCDTGGRPTRIRWQDL